MHSTLGNCSKAKAAQNACMGEYVFANICLVAHHVLLSNAQGSLSDAAAEGGSNGGVHLRAEALHCFDLNASAGSRMHYCAITMTVRIE